MEIEPEQEFSFYNFDSEPSLPLTHKDDSDDNNKIQPA